MEQVRWSIQIQNRQQKKYSLLLIATDDMHSFRMWRDEASVSRQSYTGGKSSFGATIATYKGYLRTLSPTKDQIGLEAFGKEFSFTTVYGADIKEADKLTIAGIAYRVK